MGKIEELDITKVKWISQEDTFLDIINQSITENYPDSDLTEDLKNYGYKPEDLLDDKKLKEFLQKMNEKYPV